MSCHSRRILTPGPTRKRKEREASSFYSSLKPSAQAKAQAAVKPDQAGKGADEPMSSNRLLAGYMAYEFLTKGTLFGQKFDPARADAFPVGGGAGSSAELKRLKPEPAEPSGKKKVAKEHGSYAEVASILKTPGAHIPGIVNPTQLSRWIQM